MQNDNTLKSRKNSICIQIFKKNYSLYIMLMATDKNHKHHRKVIIFSIALTFRRRDVTVSDINF